MALKTDKKLRNEQPIQVSAWVPHQLSTRLDALCGLVNADNPGRVHRKDLVAALLYGAPETSEALLEILKAYIEASPEQATVGVEKGGTIYPFPDVKPGPRAALS